MLEKHVVATHSFSELTSYLRWAISVLEGRDISVNPSARFSFYQRSISRALSYREGQIASADQEETERHHRALIDTEEMYLILRELLRPPEISEAYWKVKAILGGAPSIDPRRDDPARNTQFELYMAARTRQAGFDVALEGPSQRVDVTAHRAGFGWFALEAKRLRSRRKLVKNLKKANRQILESDLRGLIAIDVSLAFREFGEVRSGESNELIGGRLNSELSNYVALEGRALCQELDKKKVLAVIFHAAAPSVIEQPQRRLGSNRVFRWFALREEGTAEFQAASDLCRRFNDSLAPSDYEVR